MKRFLCVLLCGALLLSAGAVSASADTARPFGDPNKSGTIDAADALLVLQCAVGKAKVAGDTYCYMDVNGDYKVDATDALAILKKAVGKQSSFTAQDNFTGTIRTAYDNFMLHPGGTAVSLVLFETTLSSYDVRVTYNKEYFHVNWNSEWFGNNNAQAIHIHAIKDPGKITDFEFFVYYEDHPSLYYRFTVTLYPSAHGDAGYSFAYIVPDFGDYVNTAPFTSEYALGSTQEMISMTYDVPSILANGNGTDCYNNYIKKLKDELSLANTTTNSDGYNRYSFVGTAQGKTALVEVELINLDDNKQGVFVMVALSLTATAGEALDDNYTAKPLPAL